jgi:F0F1-type ATP synthase delta subunit
MKKNKHLDPIITQALKASFKDGKILESQVVKLMNIFKRLSKTEAVYLVSGYLKSIKIELAKHTLVIESVIPLSKTELSEIKKHTKQITINYELLTINPLLLGGIRAKVGDTVYDLSLKGKLQQLKEVISR